MIKEILSEDKAKEAMTGRPSRDIVHSMDFMVPFGTTAIDGDGNIIDTSTHVKWSSKKPKGAPGKFGGRVVSYAKLNKAGTKCRNYTPYDEQFVNEVTGIEVGGGVLMLDIDVSKKCAAWQFVNTFRSKLIDVLQTIIEQHNVTLDDGVCIDFKLILNGSSKQGNARLSELPVYGDYGTHLGMDVIGWSGALWGQFVRGDVIGSQKANKTVMAILERLFVDGLGVSDEDWANTVSKTVSDTLLAVC